MNFLLDKHKFHIVRVMNKLPLEKRIQVLNLLVEGSSMRSISRICEALYTVWYNYVRQHKSLKGLSPAMAAGP
jgi:hypothetical protein